MRISDIHIERYGVCEDISFASVNAPILVVFGPNEAGKTTTMEFIRTTLFGPTTATNKTGIAISTANSSGELRVYDHEGNHWHISRSQGQNPSLEITINGQLHPNSSLIRDLLGGIGPDVFRSVFTVGLGELQRLNQLNATDAADFLYDMTTGYDRVSLGSVLRSITTGRELILDANGFGGLAETRDGLKNTRDQLALYHNRITEWSTSINRLRSKQESITLLRKHQADLRQRQHAIEASIEIHDLVSEAKGIEEYIAAHQHVTTLSEKPLFLRLQDLAEYGSDAHKRSLEVIRLEDELLEAMVARDSLQALLAPQDLRVRLQAFVEMLPWLKSLKRELDQFSAKSANALDPGLSAKPLGTTDEPLDVSIFNHKLLKALRLPARELKRSQERVRAATLEVKSLTTKCFEAEQDWLENPAWTETTLLPDLERPSFCLADAIRQQHRKVRELDRQVETREQHKTQVSLTQDVSQQDFPSLVLSATIFSVGGTMIGMGLLFPTYFGLSTAAALFCSLIGLLAITGGIFTQLRDQKRIAEREQNNARFIELTKIREKAGPNTNGRDPIDGDLKDNRQLLDVLLTLNKQASNIERIRISLHAANERLAHLNEAAEQSQLDWERQLEGHGVSKRLTPSELYNVVEDADDLQTWQRQQLDHDSQLRRTSIEFAELELRLTALLSEFDDQHCNLPIGEKLQLLEILGHEQDDIRKEVAKLEDKLANLNERLKIQDAAVASANRSMFSDLSCFGVATLYEMDQLFRLAEECKRKRLRQAEISHQIQESCIKNKCDEDEPISMASQSIAKLELLWNENEQALENAESELAELNQAIGRLESECKHISEPADFNELRLKEASLSSEELKLETNWKIWATSELISSRVRNNYESQRQPETLRDASQWLEEITGGAYVRVWTPLGEDVLFVDDNSGQSWSIDSLSRGTRESIFLSLRFALVRSFQKEGVSLPLILDDVLVNYDLGRVKNAISAIRRFADEVGQVLFFTCHEHITHALKDAQADIRTIERPEKIVAPQLLRLTNSPVKAPLNPAQFIPPAATELCEGDAEAAIAIPRLNNADSCPQLGENDGFGAEIELEIATDRLPDDTLSEAADRAKELIDNSETAFLGDTRDEISADPKDDMYLDDRIDPDQEEQAA